MGTEHVHTSDQRVDSWGRNGMAAHLEAAHGMTIPVSWDLGRLHQAHLEAHAGPVRAHLATLAPGLPPLKGPFPMPDDQPTLSPRRVRQEPLDAMRVPLREADPEWAARQAEAEREHDAEQTEGPWRVGRHYGQHVYAGDRPVATFHTAEDAGTAVSAVNRAEADQQRIAQLEEDQRRMRGEIAELSAENDSERDLVTDLEEVNNALRQQLALTGRQLEEAKEQLANERRWKNEAADARNDAERKLEEAKTERDLLRGDKARLKAELEQVRTGSQRNVGSIDALEADLAEARDERDRAQKRLVEKLAEAEALRGERDRAITAGRVLEAQRDDARRYLLALEAACERRADYPRGIVGDTLNNLQGRAEAAESALEQARQDCARLTSQRDAVNGKAQEFHDQLGTTRRRIVGQEARLTLLGGSLEACSRDLADMTRERDEAKAECDRLRTVLAKHMQLLGEGRERLRQWSREIRKDAERMPDPSWIDYDGQKVLDRIEAILTGSVSTEPEALTGVVAPVRHLRAVEDHLPQLDASDRQGLVLTVPLGTARVALTFIPEDESDG